MRLKSHYHGGPRERSQQGRADHPERGRRGAALVLRRRCAHLEGHRGGDRRCLPALRGPDGAGQDDAAARPPGVRRDDVPARGRDPGAPGRPGAPRRRGRPDGRSARRAARLPRALGDGEDALPAHSRRLPGVLPGRQRTGRGRAGLRVDAGARVQGQARGSGPRLPGRRPRCVRRGHRGHGRGEERVGLPDPRGAQRRNRRSSPPAARPRTAKTPSRTCGASAWTVARPSP